MQQGWIKLHRQIQDSMIWSSNEPFDNRSAWIDLLLLANHEDKEILVNDKIVTIERGQLHRSQLFFAARWRWDRKRIKKFLIALKNAKMITFSASTNGATRGTTITIVNYDKYQVDGTTDGTTNGTADDTATGATTGQQTGHKQEIKNVKNVKEEKKDIYTSDIAEVLDYLNSRTGKKFTGKSKAHRQHIVARLKEGFTVEDFKKVIDNKVAAWGHSEKMAPYLRPETLFSSKFETYLNDVETERQKQKREEREIHEQQLKAIRMASDFDVGFLQ